MEVKRVFDIIRGSNGVGSWNLNRRFVHEFGLLPALLLADFARAYTYSLKIHTNMGKFFPWNPTGFMNATSLTEKQLNQCLRKIDRRKLLKVKIVDEVSYVWVDWVYLESINHPVSLSEYSHE
jgi:hypothetical protein